MMGQLIKIYCKGRATAGETILCIICTICISGSNEVSVCFLLMFLILNLWIYYRIKEKTGFLLILLIAVVIGCLLFLIVPAGSGKRAHHFESGYSFSNGFVAAFLYTTRTLYKILSEPIAWLVIAIAWITGNQLPQKVKEIFKKEGIRSIYIFLICLLTSFFFYFIIYFLSGELLPPRANNLMNFYVLLFLIITSFFSGVRVAIFNWSSLKQYRNIVGVGIIVIFLTNDLFTAEVKNIFTGYFYHKVMRAREASIENAKENGRNSVLFASYETDFDKYMNTAGTGKFAKQFIDKLEKYPVLIHYLDPVSDTSLYIHYYAEYKKIDTIEYQGTKFIRTGLLKLNP
jgi:hypothetical protein